MDEDDVWQWQPPTAEPGNALVLYDGLGGHVAPQSWRRVTCPYCCFKLEEVQRLH